MFRFAPKLTLRLDLPSWPQVGRGDWNPRSAPLRPRWFRVRRGHPEAMVAPTQNCVLPLMGRRLINAPKIAVPASALGGTGVGVIDQAAKPVTERNLCQRVGWSGKTGG